MKKNSVKPKIEKLSRDEMHKICGGDGAVPVIVVIDGKTVIFWP